VKREIKIGLIMFATLGSLIWGINFLKGKNFFSNTKDYIVIYEDVSGLLESNGVYIKGYKVGHVSSISFSDSSFAHLKVVLSIKKTINIPKNTIARIYNLDLIGNKAVELNFSRSNEFCKENDTIIGEVETTIAKMLEPYKVQAYKLLNSMDSVSNAIYKVFDKQTIQNMKETFRNLRVSSEILASSSENIALTLENVRAISANLRDNNKQVNKIVSNFVDISDSIKEIRIEPRLMLLDSMLTESRSLIHDIKGGSGTVSRLLYQDSLYNSLLQTTNDLDSFINSVKENPKNYLHFSVFGKKNK
jgi:phospholipid/cholesterol/gamma-HCH transport system substrate-binding protein